MASLPPCDDDSNTQRDIAILGKMFNEALNIDDCSVFKDLTLEEVSSFEETTGQCLLAAACKHGATKMINVLLEKGCELNIDSIHTDKQPLFLSIQHGSEDIVRKLITAGADITRLTQNGENALHLAVKHKASSDVIKALISAGCSVNAEDNNGRFPLLVAIEQFMFETLKVLTESGADINRQFAFTIHQKETHKPCFFENGSCSGTVVHFMLTKLCTISFPQQHKIFVDMVLHLINCDSDLSVTNSYGHTILDTALCNVVDLNIVEAILQKGCKANLSNVFQSACFYPYLDTTAADLLYGHGFKNVNAASERWTCPPLLVAYMRRSEKMIQWLLQHGANPNATNNLLCGRHRRIYFSNDVLPDEINHGLNILHIICSSFGHYKQDYHIVKLLCEHGANVNAQTPAGNTPLIVALKKTKYLTGSKKVQLSRLMILLLQASADPDIANANGRNALQVCLHYNDEHLSLMLLEVSVKLSKFDILTRDLFVLDLPERAIKSLVSKPRNLKVLCRRAILQAANGMHLHSRANLSQLPDPLYKYVMLHHLQDPDWYKNPYTLMEVFPNNGQLEWTKS